MSKQDFVVGSSSAIEFFEWMDERHRIWIRRDRNDPAPWTDDPILRDRKFTNVFRELDRGTLALRTMTEAYQEECAGDLLFNIAWYRMFNRAEHATDIGWCDNHSTLKREVTRKYASGKKLFTSAHMHYGTAMSTLRSLKRLFDDRHGFAQLLMTKGSIEFWTKALQEYEGIGRFIAYEIATDLRHYFHCRDSMSWASVGPGSARGLARLGLEQTNRSMQDLLTATEVWAVTTNSVLRKHFTSVWPPFEMREIEHSLCEFDKYARGGGKELFDWQSR